MCPSSITNIDTRRDHHCTSRITDIFYLFPFHDAANGQFDMLRMLLDAYPNGAKMKNNHGLLPLHVAATCHSKCVPPLLVAFQAGAKEADKFGMLPLHWAVMGNGENIQDNLTIIHALMDAFPDAVTVEDHHGFIPLHKSIYYGHAEIVEALLTRSHGRNLFSSMLSIDIC